MPIVIHTGVDKNDEVVPPFVPMSKRQTSQFYSKYFIYAHVHTTSVLVLYLIKPMQTNVSSLDNFNQRMYVYST